MIAMQLPHPDLKQNITSVSTGASLLPETSVLTTHLFLVPPHHDMLANELEDAFQAERIRSGPTLVNLLSISLFQIEHLVQHGTKFPTTVEIVAQGIAHQLIVL